MLKIKDSVDLKELEKFGFEYRDWLDDYYIDIANDRRGAGVALNIVRRYLRLIFAGDDCGGCGEDYINDVIYDLIQDGLVEKVNGE